MSTHSISKNSQNMQSSKQYIHDMGFQFVANLGSGETSWFARYVTKDTDIDNFLNDGDEDDKDWLEVTA